MTDDFLGLRGELAETAAGPIEFARVGAGPAVMLVHGTPGSWRQAAALAHDLAPDFTVLLPSRPGYGRTPLSSGRTMAQQAALYAALLDTLGLGVVGVVGISGGGPSSQAMAQHLPARVGALVMCCAVSAPAMEVPAAMRLAATVPGLGEGVAWVTRRISRRRPDAAAMDRAMARSLTRDERRRAEEDPRIRTDLVDFLHSHALAPAGIGGLRNDIKQWSRMHRLASKADRVAMPLLVMHGDADDVVPLVHAHLHAQLSTTADMEVYLDAGHVFLFTRRPEVVERMRAFLLRSLAH